MLANLAEAISSRKVRDIEPVATPRRRSGAITKSVLAVMRAASGPLTIAQVQVLLQAGSGFAVNESSVRWTLQNGAAAKRGEIAKVGPATFVWTGEIGRPSRSA